MRLPDAALGVVRPLRPGCPAKKRLPWPELREETKIFTNKSRKRLSIFNAIPSLQLVVSVLELAGIRESQYLAIKEQRPLILGKRTGAS